MNKQSRRDIAQSLEIIAVGGSPPHASRAVVLADQRRSLRYRLVFHLTAFRLCRFASLRESRQKESSE